MIVAEDLTRREGRSLNYPNTATEMFSEAYFAFPEGGIFFEVIEGHRESVIRGLKEYKGNPGVRAKYEWAARYHNYVCSEFAERYAIPSDPDCDEIYAAVKGEAQRLLDYKIDIESMAVTPCRISLRPINLKR